MSKPRIFVSCVTAEFATLRKKVSEILLQLGYDPEWQDIFGTEAGDLRQMLRDKIDDCDGLIQIVGQAYGAEPPEVDPEFGRVSYTQLEFLYARRRGKKTWLIFPGDGCTRDRPFTELDLPADTNINPVGWQNERRAIQDAYRNSLRSSGHLWHEPANDDKFALAVKDMRNELVELRRGFRIIQRRVLQALAVIVVLLCVIVGGVWWTQHSLKQEIHESQAVSSARLRAHLLQVDF